MKTFIKETTHLKRDIIPGYDFGWGLEIDDLDKWMIGFDTAHLDDTLLIWSKEAVQNEADNLLKQCKQYIK